MIFQAFRLCLGLLATAALLTIAGYLVIYLPGLHRGANASGPVAQDFSRTDFITIILTAVAVMLAILGLLLAIAGAIGYVTVRSAAEEAAERAAIKVAEDAAERAAVRVAGERAEAVATRQVRELLPQLLPLLSAGAANRAPDEGDAFAQAEGEK